MSAISTKAATRLDLEGYLLQLTSSSQVQYIPSVLSLLSAGPGCQPVEQNEHIRLHVVSELG